MCRPRAAHVRGVRSLGIVTFVISSSLLLLEHTCTRNVVFTSAEGAVHKKITANRPRRKLASIARARSLSSCKGKGKGGSKGGTFGCDEDDNNNNNNNNFAGYGDDHDAAASTPGIFSDELISTIVYPSNPTDPSTTTTVVYPTGPSNSINEGNGFSDSQNGEDVVISTDELDQHDDKDLSDGDGKKGKQQEGDVPPFEYGGIINAYLPNEDKGTGDSKDDQDSVADTTTSAYPPSKSTPQGNADDTWAVILNGDHGIDPQDEDSETATPTDKNNNDDGSPQDNNESSLFDPLDSGSDKDKKSKGGKEGDEKVTTTNIPDASTITTKKSKKESKGMADQGTQEDVDVETDSTVGLQIPTDPSTESTTTSDQDPPTDPDSEANQGSNSEAYDDTKGTESDAADNSNGNPTSAAGSIDKDPPNGTTDEGDGNSKEPGPTGSDTTYEDSNEPATMDLLGSDEDAIQLLDMPRGLVVSIFLSEANVRRLQASPVDVGDEGEFQFVLDGIGETKSTLKDFLARHLNDDLVGTVNGLQFISIESISAFLETKSYNGNPTPAVVVSDIKGSAYHQGIETPSPRILEANTLGSFNNKDSKDILLSELQASADNILASSFDIKAEINRAGISPTSDSAVASSKDVDINADSGDAARTSGIAIGGIIIVIALFLVGRRLTRNPTKHNELVSLEEGSDALDEKYDLSSIASETAFESTMISTTINDSRGERSIVEHNRNIVIYDGCLDEPQEGHGALTPMDEGTEEETKNPRSGYTFSPSSLKKATLDSGLKKEITAASLLGESSYDMSSIGGNASGNVDGPDKTSSPGHSVYLLEGGLARNHDLDKTSDTNRAVMTPPHSQEQDEDVSIPSTVDLDEVNPTDAAERLGLGIRSFSDVMDQQGNDPLPTIMSSPMPVATPEKMNCPTPSPQMENVRYSEAQSDTSVSHVTVTAANLATQQEGGDTSIGSSSVIYDPVLVGGRVQMKARSPPFVPNRQ